MKQKGWCPSHSVETGLTALLGGEENGCRGLQGSGLSNTRVICLLTWGRSVAGAGGHVQFVGHGGALSRSGAQERLPAERRMPRGGGDPPPIDRSLQGTIEVGRSPERVLG